MPELKQLGGTLADLATKGVDKIGSAVEKALPYIQSALGYVSENGDKVVKVIEGMVVAFAGMKAAPLIESLLEGGGRLLFGSTTLSGKRSGGLASLAAGGLQAGNLLSYGAKLGVAKNASGKGGIFGTIKSGAAGILGTFQNWGGLTSQYKKRNANARSALATMLQQQGANGGLGGMIKSMLSNSTAGKTVGNISSYFGNIGQSVKDIEKTTIGGAIGGGLKSAGSFIGGGLQSLGGMAKTGIGNVISTISASKPGQAIGSAAGWIGNGISNIAGTVGNIGSTVGGVLSKGLGTAGSFAGSILNVATTALGPVSGMFGTLLSGALPIVGVISSIIAVFSILGDHIEDVRGIIQSTFGDKGVAVFDKFTEKIGGIKDTITGLFQEGGVSKALRGVAKGFWKVLGNSKDKDGLLSKIFGGKGDSMANGMKTFNNVVGIIQSIMNVVGQVVNFATTQVKPIIEEIFTYITTTVMPILISTFNSAAPTITELIGNIGTAVMTVASIIADVISALLPVIEVIITTIMTVASVAVPTALAGFNALWSGLSAIIVNIKGIIEGLITFITGVFTGNWKQAWEGVKQIFGNAFNALVNLFKTPMNAVIAMINKAIECINGLGITIPSWVPEIGGEKFGLDIPKIPMLAKGGFTNGVSIAGEAGQEAVISFDRSVRNQNIATWKKAGELLGLGTGTKELKQVDAGGQRSSDTVTFAPTIYIQGNADQSTVDGMVDQMQDMFERWYEKKKRTEARTAY
jgi:hypothetical protein